MRLQVGVFQTLLHGVGLLVAQREQAFRPAGSFCAVARRSRGDRNILDVVHVDAGFGRRRGRAAHIVRDDHLDARRGVGEEHLLGVVQFIEPLVGRGLHRCLGLALHAEQLDLDDAGLRLDGDFDGFFLVLVGRDRRLGEGHDGRRNGLVLDLHRLDAHLSVVVNGLDLEASVEFVELDHFVEGPRFLLIFVGERQARIGFLSRGLHAGDFDRLQQRRGVHFDVRAGLLAADGLVVRPFCGREDDRGGFHNVDDRDRHLRLGLAAEQVDGLDHGLGVVRLVVDLLREAVTLGVEELGDGGHGNRLPVRGVDAERNAFEPCFRFDDGDDRQVVDHVEVGFERVVCVGDGRFGGRRIDSLVVVAGCERHDGENPGQ